MASASLTSPQVPPMAQAPKLMLDTSYPVFPRRR